MALLDYIASNPIGAAVTGILGFGLVCYWWLTKNYGYFEKKGLFCLKPQLIFGNAKDMYMQTVTMNEFFMDIYKKMEGHK